VDWINRRGGAVTARQLSHGLRRFRGDSDGAEAMLVALVEAGYGEWEPVPPSAQGGKPTRVFRTVSGVTVTDTSANVGDYRGYGDGDSGDDSENEVTEWMG